VFNDDDQPIRLPMLARRAGALACGSGGDVLRRTAALPNRMRLKATP